MKYSSSEQSISWFRDRYRDGSLSIKPPYQRNPVWAGRQKCYLVDSILLNLPIPEIYIQRSTSVEGDEAFAIVDGQQRIRTVLQFIGVEMDPDEQDYNKFVLDQLDTNSPWRNCAFADLSDDTKKRFYGYIFAVRFLDTESEEPVRDMFRRLNQFLTPLKPQELRNARYVGPFVKFVNGLADNTYWAENRIITPASIRRMGDVEYVAELVIGVLHGPQSGSAATIDGYYAQYEDYDDEFPDQQRAAQLFDNTLDTLQRLLPDIKGTRWSNKGDSYTLFVVLAALLRQGTLPSDEVPKVTRLLHDFADEVDRRRSDETAAVSKNAITYLNAVERGANEKRRRADRHFALLEVISPHFNVRKPF